MAMKPSEKARRFSRSMWAALAFPLIAILFLAPFILGDREGKASAFGNQIQGLHEKGEAAIGSSIPLKNSRFAAGKVEEAPIRDWKFEAIKLEIEKNKWSVRVNECSEASLQVPDKSEGALLEGTTETARGDLLSSPFHVEPFRWVKVTVEYTLESGEPLPFVCLRPKNDRRLVDLEFLPRSTIGKKKSATVMLHSGISKGPYSLSVCLMGKGHVRYTSIHAEKLGEYPRPKKPVLVLDMMHGKPVRNGNYGWEDIRKLVKVFGFPAVNYIHFTELTAKKIEELDPALVVLSPKSEELPRTMETYESLMTSVQTAVDHGAPVIGICLGHQVLARLYEDKGAEHGGRQPEWGPTKHKVIKNDPLFDGLPRLPHFYVSESHNYAVKDAFPGVDLIASSDACKAQIFHYQGKNWYTFQGHIEYGWEWACAEAYLLWKNMFRSWGLIPKKS